MKKFLTLLILGLMLLLAPAAFGEGFTHPGALHTQADFDRIKAALAAGQQPYVSGMEALESSSLADPNWSPRAVDTIIRGGNGDNVALLYNDVARAYQCALRWKIKGDAACGETAKNILNAWSSTLTTVSGNADRYLASGIYGYQLANAAELMRDYPGFDVPAMKNLLINVFYKPLCERFLISNEFGRDHNDAHIQNYWANWDLCNMAATVAIGIFCDDRDIYNQGLEYFKYGAGNGSIYNAIPALFPGSMAQWQESGRDQGHANLGIGLMAATCEMAWNQGDDLYGWADNRFMYAAEYVARYNNGDDVPYMTYEWQSGQGGNLMNQPIISEATRGEMRPIWEMVYNHYHNRRGFEMPNVARRAEQNRPEGGPGGHGSTFDQTGFGTLLFTRPAGGEFTAQLPQGNVAEGVYRIVSRRTGKVISGDYKDENNKIVQKTLDEASDAQKWIIAHLGGGQYTVTNLETGLSLAVESENRDNGAALVQEPYQARNSQKFVFLPVKDSDCFRISAVHCSKAVDISGGSDADGTDIIQWRYSLADNQQWKLELVEARDTDVPALADPTRVYVTINGDYMETDVAPTMDNGRVLVPVRAIFEALNGEMTWNASTQTIIAHNAAGSEIVIKIGSKEARIDGETYYLDVPAKIVDGRTLVPLRFVSESLNADIVWNDKTRTAEIQK